MIYRDVTRLTRMAKTGSSVKEIHAFFRGVYTKAEVEKFMPAKPTKVEVKPSVVPAPDIVVEQKPEITIKKKRVRKRA